MTPDIRLYPRGATPGHLYRDAKVYKPLVKGKPKFQPIISSVGTIGHQVAKYLLQISEPLEINEYFTKDLFIFVKKIKVQKQMVFLASMDIESLFINLPLNETI